MFSLICVWINGWVNNREARDFRRYRRHYDVIVMATNHVGCWIINVWEKMVSNNCFSIISFLFSFCDTNCNGHSHYDDVIMGTIASKITSLTFVYTIVYSDADQRKHQSSTSLAFVWQIHRGPVNSPHKGPVTRKMSPFNDVIMPRIIHRWHSCYLHQSSGY